MIQAIVYTSNTGSTALYARMLARETGLPALERREASAALARGAEVICLGWIMANGVQGYAEAAQRYRVRMVCAVGIGRTGSCVAEIREKNRIPADVALFTLQGGFHPQKLRGVQRLLMRLMAYTVKKNLAGKPDRTPDEHDLLDLMTNGGSRVSQQNLAQPLEWCRAALREQ
ncbi:MAG: hypothetical protein ACI4XW_12145 [Candidatus Spyradocola sp.]